MCFPASPKPARQEKHQNDISVSTTTPPSCFLGEKQLLKDDANKPAANMNDTFSSLENTINNNDATTTNITANINDSYHQEQHSNAHDDVAAKCVDATKLKETKSAMMMRHHHQHQHQQQQHQQDGHFSMMEYAMMNFKQSIYK